MFLGVQDFDFAQILHKFYSNAKLWIFTKIFWVIAQKFGKYQNIG